MPRQRAANHLNPVKVGGTSFAADERRSRDCAWITGHLEVMPGTNFQVLFGDIAIDLPQARFWIASGWPTIRGSSRHCHRYPVIMPSSTRSDLERLVEAVVERY